MRLLAVIFTAILGFAGAASGETEYDPLLVVNPIVAIVRANDQRALIADVNIARLRDGLRAVTTDELLSQAAQIHAENMATHRFFGHTGPDGASLPDRLAKVGFVWTVVAENIALDEDERHANRTMLDSPPHRANILDSRVQKIGVAALRIGQRATLYVEDFAL